MKHLQIAGLIVCVTVVIGCKTTQTGGQGNQERKRLAALRQAGQAEHRDEAEQNLWSAQQDNLNRDGNPARNY
jgi:hypothetical protein